MSTDPESNDTRANGSAAATDVDGAAPGSGDTAAPTAGGSTAAGSAANGSPSFAGPATAVDDPPAESRLAPEDSAADGDASAAAEGAEEGAVSAPASAARRTPGVLSAEMFSIAGAFALLGSLIGTRVVELAASVTAASQEGMIKTMAAGDGVFALVAVVLSGASLIAAGSGTRTWTRWLAGAVLLVGVLLVATAAATYLLVPPPAPPQPMVPGMGG
ncbi:hypothetical protein [Nocardiopsis coralliicola]